MNSIVYVPDLLTKPQFDQLMRLYAIARGTEYLPHALKSMYACYCHGQWPIAVSNAIQTFKRVEAMFVAQNHLQQECKVRIKPRQSDIVLDHLQRHGSLNMCQVAGYGIQSIAAVVSELRKLGHDIKIKNGVYVLVEEKA